MPKRITLDYQTRDWISDRVENEEPLYWNEYVNMISGTDDAMAIKPSEMSKSEKAMLEKLKSPEYKKAAEIEYYRQKFYFKHGKMPSRAQALQVLQLKRKAAVITRYLNKNKRKRVKPGKGKQAAW